MVLDIGNGILEWNNDREYVSYLKTVIKAASTSS